MPQPNSSARSMRTFLIVWSGQLASLIGSGLTYFALGVWIFQRTGQATPFAAVAMLVTLPRVLLAPLAGSVADRLNRRRVMIVADTGDALLTVAVVLLALFDRLAVWQILLLAPISTIFSIFQEVAYSASITMLVPKKHLARAISLNHSGQAIQTLASPLLAGLLFNLIGLKGIVFVNFGTYLLAVGILLAVRIPQPEALPAGGKGVRAIIAQEALFGWRYIRARIGLLGLLVYAALVNFGLYFAVAIAGPMVLSFATAATLGAAQTAAGVGMLLGTLVMGAWGGPRPRIYGVLGFTALAGLGMVLTGLHPSGFLVSAGMFLALFFVALSLGPNQAIFQSKVVPAAQGRVFAMRDMIARSMIPLAFLSAGPLADYVFEPWMQSGGLLADTILGDVIGVGPGRGMALMLVLAGIFMVLISAMAFAYPRVRCIEDDLPDAAYETGGEIVPAQRTAENVIAG